MLAGVAHYTHFVLLVYVLVFELSPTHSNNTYMDKTEREMYNIMPELLISLFIVELICDNSNVIILIRFIIYHGSK